jgi:hypothetical protein
MQTQSWNTEMTEAELLAAAEAILAEAVEKDQDDEGHITTEELATYLRQKDERLSGRRASEEARRIWRLAEQQNRLSHKKVQRSRISGPWWADGYKVLPVVE